MSISLELLRAMAGLAPEQQMALAQDGILEGRWTAVQVAAFLDLPDREPARRERKPRAPTVTRRTRLSARRCCFSRFVRRFSTDILVHPHLSTGAVTTLTYLISRCGRGSKLTTCTSWLAADLGVTSRTIQNHFRLLEQAGFIVRSRPDRRGRTTLYLTEKVEVRPLKARRAEAVAWRRNPAKNVSPTYEMNSINPVPETRNEPLRRTGGSGTKHGKAPPAALAPATGLAALRGMTPSPRETFTTRNRYAERELDEYLDHILFLIGSVQTELPNRLAGCG
jgi:DNA-binding MarR family transcriptional regulator